MHVYTWDAILEFTNCKLEISPDVDLIILIEIVIRDGTSVCSRKIPEANNDFMTEYDSGKPF